MERNDIKLLNEIGSFAGAMVRDILGNKRFYQLLHGLVFSDAE